MNPEELARRVRATCLESAKQAYEDAGVQGLCAEGRWEAALSAIEAIDVRTILGEIESPSGAHATQSQPAAGDEARTK